MLAKMVLQRCFLSLIPCTVRTRLSSYLPVRKSCNICSPRWKSGQMVVDLDGNASRPHSMVGKRAKLSKTSNGDIRPWLFFSAEFRSFNLLNNGRGRLKRESILWHPVYIPWFRRPIPPKLDKYMTKCFNGSLQWTIRHNKPTFYAKSKKEQDSGS
jgi:hypothetical protein